VSPADLRKLLAANVRELAAREGVSLNKLADLSDALGKHPSALFAPRDGASKRKR